MFRVGSSLGQAIRVASVPGNHWYVRHLSHPEGLDRVTRLPDPPPESSSGWWPPLMLEPEWVKSHADDFDVFHIHFGFDGRDERKLRELGESLRRHEKPLVFTVHDLRNPHHTDPDPHDSQVAVLLDHSDVVLTLTNEAARQIEERWGVRAEVVPHPHILPEGRLPPPQGCRPAAGRGAIVGLHLKSLRENMFGAELLDGIADRLARTRNVCLRIDVHD
jgi:hypothetical protein